MAIHDLRLLEQLPKALKLLGLQTGETAEQVLQVITTWAQGRTELNSEEKAILSGVPGYMKKGNGTEELKKSIATVLKDKHGFSGSSDESVCWSGTDVFGNLRVSQCLGKVALSTLVRPATAKWLHDRWEAVEAKSRFAFLLMLFYSGSEQAIKLLNDAGDNAPRETYAKMRHVQLQSDSWILKNCLYNLRGPAPGGGIDIKATSAMKAIVLLVRDLAVPIAAIIGMVAVVATAQAWPNSVGTKLAIVASVITFVDIVATTLWNNIIPGTLAEWHILGETRISSLSKKFSISPLMLKAYNRAGVATTFSGTVRRTATGPTSCWAPDTGEVGFHSLEPVALRDLCDWGLVGGFDRILEGPVMLRNVYGRTTGVEVEVIEELDTDFFHSYHMPSSGRITRGKPYRGVLGRCNIVSVTSSRTPA